MKILYVTAIGGTMDFFIDTIKTLISKGNIVDLACNLDNSDLNPIFNDFGCKHFDLSCSRNLSVSEIIKTVREIKNIVKNGDYDIVHCHTPIAATCTRLACRRFRKKGLKVVYTAHGFHFYKGAPMMNWLVFYPTEWICSFFTDALITINHEDYELAKKRMHSKMIKYIPGVGVDLEAFKSELNNNDIRNELGIPNNAKILLSIGNLNENKNHSTVIKAIEGMDVYYLIAGTGDKAEELIKQANSIGMGERVKLLGYRTDVPDLLNVSDIFIFPSYREGLSVSLMETMASGTPAIVSDIRGNRDLIIDNSNGYLCNPSDVDEFRCAINKLLVDDDLREKMGKDSIERIKPFSKYEVIPLIEGLYKNL